MEYPDDQNDVESDSSGSVDFQADAQHHIQKKPRSGNACLTCRRMKTRCEYFDASSPCKLCAKSNRECVKSPPRRRRQKTVARIADLEQRIQSLTSALVDKAPIDDRLLARQSTMSNPTSSATGTSNTSSNVSPKPKIESITPDVIDKGFVDKITGYAAFHRYREKMNQYYGFVPLPPDLDVDIYRRRKPLLFSTLVLAGINSIRPDLVAKIADDLLKTLSDRIHVRAERSLELVQCLLIYVCYHCRTLQREHMNFYQNITTALTMALDLGLGRRSGNTPIPRWIPEEDMMDARRAYLGCYYMSGQAAISLRHPLFIRWGPYIEECLEVLSTDPRRVPSDIWLVDLTRLHRIAEDAHFIFSMDDPGSTVSLREPKYQYHLTALEEQLERWRKEAKGDLSSLRYRICCDNVNVYIHEIALHCHHNIDSFRVDNLHHPPDLERLTSFMKDMDISPTRIDALYACATSAHSYLDSLLNLDVDTLRCLPNMYYVRSGYCCVTLKWLDEICGENSSSRSRANPASSSESRSDSISQTQRSNYPNMIVKFDWYIESLIKLYTAVGNDGKCNIATALRQVLLMIRDLRLRTVIDGQTQTSSTHNQESNRAISGNAHSASTVPGSVATRNNPDLPSTSADTLNPLAHPQQLGEEPFGATEFDFNMPGIDTAMFDVSALNYLDPGFTYFGVWDQGGWNGVEEETSGVY